MAQHIHGPLYYERMGRKGPVIAFVHPNPMDQSCWIFQMAHLSTWYRCVAIDIPGYGRSPKADAGIDHGRHGRGLLGSDRRRAARRESDPRRLFGRIIIAPYMYHLRPDKTAALVLSGTGYNPTKEFTKRIDAYTANGIDYRWAYTFEDLSPAFRATPLAHFFANLFTERNEHADVETIIHQFKALAQPYPEGHHERIACPTIILTGSEDGSHQRAFAFRRVSPIAS